MCGNSHLKRDGNRPTHLLVQYAKYLDSYQTWIEENPNMVELLWLMMYYVYLLLNKAMTFYPKKKKVIIIIIKFHDKNPL